MNGRKAVSSDILGIEVGRFVLRGVVLDAAVANVVDFAEVPLRPFPGESPRVGSANCALIGPSFEILLSRLGLDRGSVFAAGIALGPRCSGVGSGPALAEWLAAQAEGIGEALVCAGELGIAFAPKDAIDGAASMARSVGLGLVRVDLAPVAAARVLIDPTHDVASVGSGVGWRARLRDLEVVEALDRADIVDDAPFQVLLPDGQIEPLTGYRRIAIPPGLRAAGFDPGQLAVAVGSAIGVANRSGADLLNGTVIDPPEKPEPAPAKAQPWSPARTGEVPPANDRTPGAQSTTVKRRPPMTTGQAARRPPRAGVLSESDGGERTSQRPGPAERARTTAPTTSARIPVGRSQGPRGYQAAADWEQADESYIGYEDEIERFSTDQAQVDNFTNTDTRIDVVIGFLLALSAILIPVYLFL